MSDGHEIKLEFIVDNTQALAAIDEVREQLRQARLELEAPLAPPAGPAIMSGPRFDLPYWSTPTDAQFHEALGVEQGHDVDGIHTIRVAADQRSYAVVTRADKRVKDERFGMWVDIDPVTDITAEFDLILLDQDGQPTDLGRQSKFGVGLYGYHSGEDWPGGGTLHKPDWSVRAMWSDRGDGGFGLYPYTPTTPKPEDITAWGEPTSPHGFRRVEHAGDNHEPKPGATHRIAVTVTGADGGNATATLTVDGKLALTAPMGPLEPCNRIVLSNRYGGSDNDGPIRDTAHRIGNIHVARGGDQ